MSEDLLFELGTEEIPPSYLDSIAKNFKEDIANSLDEARLDYEDIGLFHSPRRLAVEVKGLQEVQEDVVRTHRGPSKEIGQDDDGNLDIPAKKFAEGHGATPEDLYLEDTEAGTYFFVEEKVEGKEASDLLKELLPAVVKNLEQPEKMRWDDSDVRFIRPIRWIVCVLGEGLVELSVGNVSSSRFSRGHRFHGSDSVEIGRARDYEEKLEKNYVIPDPEKRRRLFIEQLEEKEEEVSGKSAADEGFNEVLINSLEYPNAVLGSFSDEFLELPDELLFKTLTGEARLMPLVDSDGKPMASFVGFRDGSEEGIDEVKDGYESVIYARLRDSKFFFEHDREQPLESYVEELDEVTFQKELGSIRDKVERIREISAELAGQVDGLDGELLDRTVLLSKADLVTEVVDEFPSLEGTIGAHYAELDGEPEQVVKGIAEHYRPRKSSDDTPETDIGVAVSIADKLDTLFGSFLIGEEPSGTRDPYGLRRKTDGIVRTIIEAELDIKLGEILKAAKELYDLRGRDEAGEKLFDYFVERIGQVLELNYGIPYDVVDAVNLGKGLKIYEEYLRATALSGFKRSRRMKDLVDSFTRVVNITEDSHLEGFDPDLFELEEEKRLWKELADKEEEFEDLLDQKDYDRLIEELLSLKKPLDDYFDNVMVMADEDRVRENRLGFLNHLKEFFFQVGDLSRIVTE